MAVLLAFTVSCEEFLETEPLGVAAETIFNTEKGVNALLTGAYALIDGQGAQGWGGGGAWAGAVSNWVWGSVASDDAYKGTSVGDQPTINPIEQYEVTTDIDYIANKWQTAYDGISRVNDALTALANTEIPDPEKVIQIRAQALFLRGWFHFEVKRVYKNIPYITEDVEDPTTVPNTSDTWPDIEADLLYAYQNLPETQAEVGRPTKYAAAAVLARVRLFQDDWGAAETLLDDIIDNGGYSLMTEYADNYMIASNNNAESIFEIQYSVNDGIPESFGGGYGDCLNFPQSGDVGTCCGFHQPSQNFVNSFKVDAAGLPLLDNFNDTDLANDMGVASNVTFVQTIDLLDPRIDFVVGRRGIPYLDWGIHRGADWIREQPNGGPYLSKKNMFLASKKGTLSTTTGWATGVNANNYRAYRLAHIYLWKAEVSAMQGDLTTAVQYVDMIRNRAKNSTPVMGLCTTYELPLGVDATVDWDAPAANYLVEPYGSFADQTEALKAIRHEMRLELGMEGHRFFDLVRWGIAAETLNAYIARDSEFRVFLQNKSFTAGKDEYWPVPQAQIDQQGTDVLQQNPGY